MSLLTSAFRLSNSVASGRAFQDALQRPARIRNSSVVVVDASGEMAPRDRISSWPGHDQLLQLVDTGRKLRALCIDGRQPR